MATLPQRFKLLATRCAAGAPSPSRSPAPSYAASASPGYRLRRRQGTTAAASARRRGRLRRFLCRRGGEGGVPDPLVSSRQEDDRKPLFGGRAGRTLRDLFVASPEAGLRRGGCGCDCEEEEDDDDGRTGACREDLRGGGAWGGSRRFRSGGLRSLLMRRSWRPVLGAIPEGEGKMELSAIEE